MAQSKKSGPHPAIPEWKVEKMIEKAETKANMAGSNLAVVLMLSVLLDKFGMEDQIKDVWAAWIKLSEEVLEGRVKLHELRNVLRKEYGIRI